MPRSAILADFLKLCADSQPFPTFSDRASVKTFVGKVAPDLIDLTYDAGGFDAVQGVFMAANPTDWFLAAKDAGLVADGALMPAWLAKLIAAIPQIIDVAKVIISIFSTPTPTPTPGPVV